MRCRRRMEDDDRAKTGFASTRCRRRGCAGSDVDCTTGSVIATDGSELPTSKKNAVQSESNLACNCDRQGAVGGTSGTPDGAEVAGSPSSSSSRKLSQSRTGDAGAWSGQNTLSSEVDEAEARIVEGTGHSSCKTGSVVPVRATSAFMNLDWTEILSERGPSPRSECEATGLKSSS